MNGSLKKPNEQIVCKAFSIAYVVKVPFEWFAEPQYA